MESFGEQIVREIAEIKQSNPEIEKIINVVITQRNRSGMDYDYDKEPLWCMFKEIKTILDKR